MQWAHPVARELQQSSPITAGFSSVTGRFHGARDALSPSEMSVWVFVSWFIASPDTVPNLELLLLLHVFCFLPFYKLSLQVEAPEISWVKPMSCANGAWVFPLGCFYQSKVLQTFVIFGFLWSTVNIMYLQHTTCRESIPNCMGSTWGLMEFD